MTIPMIRGLAIGAVLLAGFAAVNASAQSLEWNEMDANHDGVVTAEEYAAYTKALFDKMDARHAGKLTKAQWTDAVKGVVAERKQRSDAMKADVAARKAALAQKKTGTPKAASPASQK